MASGRLLHDLLTRYNHHHKKKQHLPSPDKVLALMERFGLVVVMDGFPGEPDTVMYFIPSLLPLDPSILFDDGHDIIASKRINRLKSKHSLLCEEWDHMKCSLFFYIGQSNPNDHCYPGKRELIAFYCQSHHDLVVSIFFGRTASIGLPSHWIVRAACVSLHGENEHEFPLCL